MNLARVDEISIKNCSISKYFLADIWESHYLEVEE